MASVDHTHNVSKTLDVSYFFDEAGDMKIRACDSVPAGTVVVYDPDYLNRFTYKWSNGSTGTKLVGIGDAAYPYEEPTMADIARKIERDIEVVQVQEQIAKLEDGKLALVQSYVQAHYAGSNLAQYVNGVVAARIKDLFPVEKKQS